MEPLRHRGRKGRKQICSTYNHRATSQLYRMGTRTSPRALILLNAILTNAPDRRAMTGQSDAILTRPLLAGRTTILAAFIARAWLTAPPPCKPGLELFIGDMRMAGCRR